MPKKSRLRSLAPIISNVYFKFGLIYLIFFLFSFHKLDPDFGWHLMSGNYYRQHGIPSHDIFSYTARDFAWINHEWGNDVIASLLYSAGGYGLLAAFYAGLWTSAFYIRARAIKLIFLLTAVAAMLPYAGIRPVAWTVLFFAGLLNLLERPKKPSIWLFAALFAIWANIHAGFFIGLVVILYYLIKNRQKYYLKLLGISVFATFINPYGPRLYEEIFRTLTDRQLHSQITEWNTFTIFRSSYIFVALWCAGFLLYQRKKIRNWLGLGPLLLAGSMSATRNLPLFIIYTTGDLEKFYTKFRSEAPNKLPVAAKILLIFAGVVLLAGVTYSSFSSFWPWGNRESSYPTAAIAYLRANRCPGHLFNDYNYGGYLIWKLPSEPVYIDGRMPSWRDKSGQKYLDTYLDVSKKAGVRKQQFAKYDIQCVLIRSSNNDLIKPLKKSGWEVKIQANGSTLLEK